MLGPGPGGTPVDRALQARAFLAAQHGSDVAVEVCATAHRLGGGAAATPTSRPPTPHTSVSTQSGPFPSTPG